MAVLECRHLTKRYGNLTALDNIDLSLEPGRIIGLVGPNGSGKTTLIKLAQHLLTPTDGEILIDGIRPGAQTKAIVSYLPDRDFLPAWMDVESLLRFYEDFYEDFDKNKAKSTFSMSRLRVWIRRREIISFARSSATTPRTRWF